jgi:uncharacterized SAM-binding protein YcdF (DUF218 family)
MRRLKARQLSLTLLAVVVALWLGGFFAFAEYLQRLGPADPPESDGIVVLTGDKQRLVAGVKLLLQHPSSRLLITGVNPHTRIEDLAEALEVDVASVTDHIDLGRNAADTMGNAEEAAVWATAHDYRSLTIVTAGYHMPRSLVEFRRRMPMVELVPYPVFPKAIRLKDWWRWPGTTRLLFVEYHKYLASRVLNALRPQERSGRP